MSGDQDFPDQLPPNDDQLRLIMFQAIERICIHMEATTRLTGDIHARLEGAMAANNAVAEVVDQNENQVATDRQNAASKELISHLFEKSHQYVTVIIAGAFAAYFATLGTLANRFSDIELRWSALLMTISLTIFVMWEVFNMFYIGHHTFRGDYGSLTTTPTWVKRGWYVVMVGTLGTALPAISLSVWVYLRGLGADDLIWRLISVH